MGPLLACNEMLAADGLDFAGQCRVARSLGYGGLEIAPGTLGDAPLSVRETDLIGMASIAADHGLVIGGLHWLLTPFPDLSITDPDRAGATRAALIRLCDICAALGGRTMVHGSPGQRRRPAGMADTALTARMADLFRPVAEHAAALGLSYCIEPLSADQTDVINTLDDAGTLVALVDHPGFVTMLDTASAGVTETRPLPEVIAAWLPTGLIGHVHLNDTRRGAPGTGHDDFAAILRALARHGWTGALSVEPFETVIDGTTTLAIGAATVRAHLSTIERAPR